jgi:hypothetical protein
MSSFGIPGQEIVRVLGINPSTMRKCFPEEFATGHVEANAKVEQALFKKATSDGHGSVIACIFWLKCRAGWHDKVNDLGKNDASLAAAAKAGSDSDWAMTWSAPGIRCSDGFGRLTGAATAKPLVPPCIGWRR